MLVGPPGVSEGQRLRTRNDAEPFRLEDYFVHTGIQEILQRVHSRRRHGREVPLKPPLEGSGQGLSLLKWNTHSQGTCRLVGLSMAPVEWSRIASKAHQVSSAINNTTFTVDSKMAVIGCAKSKAATKAEISS